MSLTGIIFDDSALTGKRGTSASISITSAAFLVNRGNLQGDAGITVTNGKVISFAAQDSTDDFSNDGTIFQLTDNGGFHLAPGFDFALDSQVGLGQTKGTIVVGDPMVAAVPELSTWAMMMLGFAGIGAMTYRRRKSAALAAQSNQIWNTETAFGRSQTADKPHRISGGVLFYVLSK